MILLLLLLFSNYSVCDKLWFQQLGKSNSIRHIDALFCTRKSKAENSYNSRLFEKETRFQTCKVHSLSWKLDRFVAARRPINLKMVLYSNLPCQYVKICSLDIFVQNTTLEMVRLFFLVDYVFMPPTFVLDNSRFISAENCENGYQNCIAQHLKRYAEKLDVIVMSQIFSFYLRLNVMSRNNRIACIVIFPLDRRIMYQQIDLHTGYISIRILCKYCTGRAFG